MQALGEFLENFPPWLRWVFVIGIFGIGVAAEQRIFVILGFGLLFANFFLVED